MQCPVFGQKRKERKRIRWRFRPSGGFAAGFAGTVTIPVSLPDMSARTRKKTTAAAVKTAVPIQEAAVAAKTAVLMQEAAAAVKTAVPIQEAAAAAKTAVLIQEAAAAVKTAVPMQEAAAAAKAAVLIQEAAAAVKTAVLIQEAAAAVKQEGKRKGLCLQKARPFFAVSMACGGLVRKATGSPLSGL